MKAKAKSASERKLVSTHQSDTEGDGNVKILPVFEIEQKKVAHMDHLRIKWRHSDTVNPTARIRIIIVHTVVVLPMAACSNFHYSDSDESRAVVSRGHRISSFVLTLSWVKAVWSFKFLRLALLRELFTCSRPSSVSLFAAPHFIAFPHARLYTKMPVSLSVAESVEVVFDLLPPHNGTYIVLQNIYFCLCFCQSSTRLLFIKSTSLSLSWSWQRVLTQMEDPSAQRATQSCPLPLREQGASETRGPPPSSK